MFRGTSVGNHLEAYQGISYSKFLVTYHLLILRKGKKIILPFDTKSKKHTTESEPVALKHVHRSL